MPKKRELGFRGTVNARLKLQDIIQMACIARTTSTIKTSRGNQKGYIYVNQGRLVHVTVATLTGQEALNELVSWDVGEFDLAKGIPTDLPKTLSGNYDALLIEAARVLDERTGLDQPDCQNAEATVGLSRGAAVEVLELIMARRRHERWVSLTRKSLFALGVTVSLAAAAYLLLSNWATVSVSLSRDVWSLVPGHGPRSVAKTFGPPVQVPGGEFFYQDGERRKLETFDIDPTEVTIAQYAEFLAAVGSSTEYDHPDQAYNKGHSNSRWIELYSAAASGRDFQGLHVTVNYPAVIAQHPVSQAALLNSNVLFAATATGSLPLAWQWRFNGQSISGATNSTLTIGDMQASNVGSYTVVVTNDHGNATSDVATLTVANPPDFLWARRPTNQVNGYIGISSGHHLAVDGSRGIPKWWGGLTPFVSGSARPPVAKAR